MTRRPKPVFVVLAVVLGAGILFALTWSPAVVTPGPRRDPRRLTSDEMPPASGTGGSTNRLRNVFVYEPAPVPLAPRVFLPELAVPPPLSLPPQSPVALVGFVRQGGGLRAALSIRGSVSVLATDESVDGYLVLAIDEDRGVTLRTPEGTETTLGPPAR